MGRRIKGKGTEKLERGNRASSTAVVFRLMLGWSHGESSQRPLLCSSTLVFSLLVSLTHTIWPAGRKWFLQVRYSFISRLLSVFSLERERAGRPSDSLCLCTHHTQAEMARTHALAHLFIILSPDVYGLEQWLQLSFLKWVSSRQIQLDYMLIGLNYMERESEVSGS